VVQICPKCFNDDPELIVLSSESAKEMREPKTAVRIYLIGWHCLKCKTTTYRKQS